MTDFYRVPVEQQQERIGRLAIEALKHWDIGAGEPELVKFRENAVFRVSGPDGKPAALRIHRHAYHSDAALASELAWMRALGDDGIEVPGVVPTRDNRLFAKVSVAGVPEERQVDMLAWVPGEPFGRIEDGLGGAITDVRDAFMKVGRMAARLHDHAASWRRPAGFERHAWDLDGLLGERPVWGRFWELKALSPTERALIDRARARARRDLEAYGRSPETYGLMHADLLIDNILLDGDRVRIIDFDDAGFGWFLFDLTTTPFFFQGEELFDPIRAAIMDGYRAVRPLSDEQLGHMPLFYLLRGFTYLGWAHTRAETQTARDLTPAMVALVCGLAETYLRH
jgi:Ser/Thr protein kinase RdoA (MazF antagonist)